MFTNHLQETEHQKRLTQVCPSSAIASPVDALTQASSAAHANTFGGNMNWEPTSGKPSKGKHLGVFLPLLHPLKWRFPTIGVPLVIIHLHGMFPYKPSILGYPHLGKPPNRDSLDFLRIHITTAFQTTYFVSLTGLQSTKAWVHKESGIVCGRLAIFGDHAQWFKWFRYGIWEKMGYK